MCKSDFTVGKRPWFTSGLSLVIVSAVMFPQAALAQIKLDVTEDIQVSSAQSGERSVQEQVQTLVTKTSAPQGTLPHTVLEVQADTSSSAISTPSSSLPPLEEATLGAAATVSTQEVGASSPSPVLAQDTMVTAVGTATNTSNTTVVADSSTNSASSNTSSTSQDSVSATPSTSESAILAATNASPTDKEAAYADSMIKPNRPNGLLYTAGKADQATPATKEATADNNSLVDQASSVVADAKAKSIVLFFSAPEQVERSDVDSLTGASIIERDNQRYGITEYVARYIGQKLEAQVYELSTTTAYPKEHSALIERAAADFNKIKSQDFSLETKLEPAVDLGQVETIYLGFPLWWNDLPLPVYAFLESTDLSGKTLVPFCTMGGNAPYQLFKQLNEIEPNAKILRGLEINKNKLVKKQLLKRLDRWLEEQGSAENSGNKPSKGKHTS